MRRACLLGWLLLAAAAGAQADASWQQRWSGLWRTPDQRGEQLLRQGDAGAAARTYADPRRRAYAELQAGDYPAAARDFAAFDDSDSHYNRGNALARAGDLEAALQAYGSALVRDPNNRDARHNRDLVARALQQRPPPPPQPGSQGQSGKSGGKPGKSAGQGQAGGRDQGKGAQGNSASGQVDNAQGGKPRQGQAGARNAGAQSKPEAQPQANPQNDLRSAAAGGQANLPASDSAAQARRDAEAGLGREAQTSAADRNGFQGRDAGAADRAGLAEAPPSERQLAQEQWLRQIPDDPGGLLRRKFMIEHLMRQQGNQP